MNDEWYMRRCLQLAKLGAGYVAPNPMVGAVLVHDGRIIGEGYHAKYGGPHAEVNCIDSVKEDDRELISKSTLYVSLEPCNHHGKTPPCTDLILDHKIPKVVLAQHDPFDLVNGSGIQRLRDAGVEVCSGILEEEARWLNRRFICMHEKRRPYVIVKWAESADHCIAGEGNIPVKISNDKANRLVHRWRAEEAAIMVGAGTARADNPFLTNRYWYGAQPTRVLVSTHLDLPLRLNLFADGSKVIIINIEKHADEGHILYRKPASGSIDPGSIMQILYKEKVQSVLIEGGAALHQSFINSGIWDEIRIIQNQALELPSGLRAARFNEEMPMRKIQLAGNQVAWYFSGTYLPKDHASID
ncbi:MAG TPA: bifunctional diaminohydroxyphosphoribosylaminopyrimidine deaminase/5-amino-6-(5-phosphoribosylamino)uracil reductase RibD [Chitinophagaceae bacterium]|nr:bifunctional diaminohydroxyphosphoribosylaminopyrimidine deaminase/5-amino-6-(5-phosphoribosylamino)uracil reductase RibD [Chitinophagaceae bacterium]